MIHQSTTVPFANPDDAAPSAVGVYIFAGGFTLGVARSFRILAHLEGSSYGVDTFKANFPRVPVWKNPATWPRSRFQGVPFIYGNPPCAAWSVAGKSLRSGKTNWLSDPRVQCTRNLFSMLESCGPTVWVWESVTQAYSRGRDLVESLTKRAQALGYGTYHLFTSGFDHGVPQPRRRFMLIASKVALDLPNPAKSPDFVPPTVGGLLGLTNTVTQDAFGMPMRAWQQTCPVWGEHRMSPRYEALARATGPGEALHETYEKLGAELGFELDEGRSPAFMAHRLRADGIGSTFTSMVMHVHPVFDRWLADSEVARLCGYPDSFVWRGPQERAQMVQAVMPTLGSWLGRQVRTGIERNAGYTGHTQVNHLADNAAGQGGSLRTPSFDGED